MTPGPNDAVAALNEERAAAKAASKRKAAAAQAAARREAAAIAGLQAQLKAECAERRARKAASP